MMDKRAVGTHKHRALCYVCQRQFAPSFLRPWISVRPGVSELLTQERGELGELDWQVIESLGSGQPISQPPEDMLEGKVTFGERMADCVAQFGDYWTFVLTFTFALFLYGQTSGSFFPRQ
nr:hypothetical protein [uncultured Halomonas sp.]